MGPDRQQAALRLIGNGSAALAATERGTAAKHWGNTAQYVSARCYPVVQRHLLKLTMIEHA